jgi:hypothetical protein
MEISEDPKRKVRRPGEAENSDVATHEIRRTEGAYVGRKKRNKHRIIDR